MSNRNEASSLVLFIAFSLFLLSCGDDDDDGHHIEPADLVVYNANVLTSDADNPSADAFAVKSEKFVYVGEKNGANAHIGPETKVIDAQGRMIVPGFIDTHCHPIWMGSLLALMTSLYDGVSFDEYKELIQQYSDQYPDRPFVMGIGWGYDFILGIDPDAELADTIIDDRPLFLWSADGHTGWVNTMALDLMRQKNEAAYNELTPALDEEDNPTGIFLHFYAFNPFDFFTQAKLGEDLAVEMAYAIEAVLQEALSVGVTTMNDVQIYKTFLPFLSQFKEQGALGGARLRFSYYIGYNSLTDEEGLLEDLEAWKGFGEANNDGKKFFAGDSVKMYIDGTFGNHTAFVSEGYSDAPDEFGYALWTQDDFTHLIGLLDSMEMQACTHGIGDAGIERAINAYVDSAAANGEWDSRHRIEHCELPKQEDKQRMAQHGIYASMQPAHFFGDETMEAVLGPERVAAQMPWGDLVEAGVNLSLGSDWCAGPFNPIYGLIIGGLRLNYKGEMTWGPQQAVPVKDSIVYWTMGSAKALKMEELVGSIEAGKYADFVIYDIDLTTVTTEEFLMENPVELGALDHFVNKTFVGGNLVYEKSGD